jgi:thiol-disulfide isomerase/thioredoxin
MIEARRLSLTLGIAAIVAAGLAYLVKDALVSSAVPSTPVAAPAPQTQRVPAGPLVVLARDGTKRDLASPIGKGQILHFWATWCGPCRDEMPALAAFVKDTKGDPNVEFLAISVDEDWKIVEEWLRERGLASLPVVLDPGGAISSRYGVDGYPETLFIAPSGEIVQHFVGMADWSKPQVRKFAAEFSRASASTALTR